jgi:hypothetical protein
MLMTSRGARSERQSALRLLETVRDDTERQLERLKAKYAAVPVLMPEQAEEVIARIVAMPSDVLVDFFKDYRVREFDPWKYKYSRPASKTPYPDYPEMDAAVERLNIGLHAYDETLLKLRISELFGGRLKDYSKKTPYESPLLINLDIFGICVMIIKDDRNFRGLPGEDPEAPGGLTLQMIQGILSSSAQRHKEAEREERARLPGDLTRTGP